MIDEKPSELIYGAIEDCRAAKKRTDVEVQWCMWSYFNPFPEDCAETIVPLNQAKICFICVAGASLLAKAQGHESSIKHFNQESELVSDFIDSIRAAVTPSLTTVLHLGFEAKICNEFGSHFRRSPEITTDMMKGEFEYCMTLLKERADWFEERGY